MSGDSLEIKLLGELEVLRAGRRVALPASRRTRALLGYLVAVARPQRREHLCELFWEYPDDPRGALRWSLSKLRPLVNDDASERLCADRSHVVFHARGAIIDLRSVRDFLGPKVEAAATDALLAAADRFRGELLEGLDLTDCYRYHEWCVGEREAARGLRISILRELSRRLEDRPGEALHFARAWVAVDPFSEAAHGAVIRLLGRLQRRREALEQYESCRRILKNELRMDPSAELERAREALDAPVEDLAPAPARASTPGPTGAPAPELMAPWVGRERERAAIADLVGAASRGACDKVLLVAGDPGIGKTRLLAEVARETRVAKGDVLSGRAFEAEMVRPYGAWIDALRSAPGRFPEAVRNDLAPLLPELGDGSAGPGERGRLFDAVARVLAEAARGSAPVAVLLDDIQWFDEASAALLHFTARALAGSHVLLACAARPAELASNPLASKLVHALARDGRLLRLDLLPLGAKETAALVGADDPRLDASRIFKESQGNPLFALEIARAMREGREGFSDSLEGIIRARLERLDARALEVLPWAAALGRSFSPEVLARVTALPPTELLGAVEELERASVLRAASEKELDYDFVHDLVRQAVYRQLSGPRRRLVHLQIARGLRALEDPDGALAGEMAHHAALGGDHELAARASVQAGERCLRLFALSEAADLAERGLRMIRDLPADVRLRLHVDLRKITVHATLGRRRPRGIEEEIAELVREAESLGQHEQVQKGLYLLAVLNEERGNLSGAQEHTMRAAQAAREADSATAVRALSNTGRCLAQIGREYERAETLLLEARRVAAKIGLEVIDIPWGLGMVRHHAGEAEEAVGELARALALARQEQDHWAECECLALLARIDLEQGRPDAALARSRELEAVASKLGEGSEGPMAAALEALARLALRDEGAEEALERALATLREIDTKGLLAQVSNDAADIDLASGRHDRARKRAEQALEAAVAVDRRDQILLARAILARVALAEADRAGALRQLEAARVELGQPREIGARARAALSRVAKSLDVPIPTSAQTQAPTPAVELDRKSRRHGQPAGRAGKEKTRWPS